MINFFAIGVLMFLGWAFVWTMIDRICTCKERCAMTKELENTNSKDSYKYSSKTVEEVQKEEK